MKVLEDVVLFIVISIIFGALIAILFNVAFRAAAGRRIKETTNFIVLTIRGWLASAVSWLYQWAYVIANIADYIYDTALGWGKGKAATSAAEEIAEKEAEEISEELFATTKRWATRHYSQLLSKELDEPIKKLSDDIVETISTKATISGEIAEKIGGEVKDAVRKTADEISEEAMTHALACVEAELPPTMRFLPGEYIGSIVYGYLRQSIPFYIKKALLEKHTRRLVFRYILYFYLSKLVTDTLRRTSIMLAGGEVPFLGYAFETGLLISGLFLGNPFSTLVDIMFPKIFSVLDHFYSPIFVIIPEEANLTLSYSDYILKCWNMYGKGKKDINYFRNNPFLCYYGFYAGRQKISLKDVMDFICKVKNETPRVEFCVRECNADLSSCSDWSCTTVDCKSYAGIDMDLSGHNVTFKWVDKELDPSNPTILKRWLYTNLFYVSFAECIEWEPSTIFALETDFHPTEVLGNIPAALLTGFAFPKAYCSEKDKIIFSVTKLEVNIFIINVTH